MSKPNNPAAQAPERIELPGASATYCKDGSDRTFLRVSTMRGIESFSGIAMNVIEDVLREYAATRAAPVVAGTEKALLGTLSVFPAISAYQQNPQPASQAKVLGSATPPSKTAKHIALDVAGYVDGRYAGEFELDAEVFDPAVAAVQQALDAHTAQLREDIDDDMLAAIKRENILAAKLAQERALVEKLHGLLHEAVHHPRLVQPAREGSKVRTKWRNDAEKLLTEMAQVAKARQAAGDKGQG